MIEAETVVQLTANGRLVAWQQGATSFESAIRELSNGLVVAADAIGFLSTRGEDFEDMLELGRQWHSDLAQLPVQARRLTLTRMIVAGIPEPKQFTVEEA